MTFSYRDIWPLLKQAYQEWSNDKAMRLSAAVAYYTIFSLAPLLIIVVAVVGMLWGGQSEAVQQELLGEISSLVGADAAGVIGTMLENANRPGSGNLIATLVGIGTLLVGATAVFVQLQDALNTIWEVRPAPDYGFKGLLMSRVLSFGLILTIGFLLLVSLIISVALSALEAFVGGLMPGTEVLLQVANFLISFGLITLLFAMIYRYLPDAEIAWRDTWVGAGMTALLFTLGKFAIGLYLGRSSVGSTYGAAGSLVVLLVWIYYSAMILFFGAEITQVWARRFGQGIRPSEHAVRVIETTEEVEGDAAADVSRNTSREVPPGTVAAPGARSRPTPLLRRALPFAAAFLVGRLTKRRKVEVVKRFVRR